MDVKIMDKNKIIIAGLAVVIIALIGAIGIFLTSHSSNVSEGMERYNFDSAFTMDVPEGTVFLKTWWDEEDTILTEGIFKDYFSKDNEFYVNYINSRMLNDERINYMFLEDLGNISTEESGDYLIVHYHDATGKVGKNIDKSDFKEALIIHKGSELIELEGNDINFLKSMADTIKFKE